MAKTVEGAQLTRLHRQHQMAVRALSLKKLMALYQIVDPSDFKATWGPFEEGLVTSIKLHRQYSAALASNYYRGFREAEGVSGKVSPKLVTEIDEEALRQSLRFAGPTTAQKVGRFRPMDVGSQVLTSLTGTTSRHVLDAGRETMLEAVRADKATSGRYVRVPTGRACSFCKMLASRGPVYAEESVGFRSHNHCGCTAEPHFGGGFSTWPQEAQDSNKLYHESTQGLSGRDAALAFRRAVEGR